MAAYSPVRFREWLIVACLVGQAPLFGAKNDTGIALYLEALRAGQESPADPGTIQRQIVLLRAAIRVAPTLTPACQQLAMTAAQVGRNDFAEAACRKFLAHQKRHALMQLQMIESQLQPYQNTDGEKEYLKRLLDKTKDLLPEITSDVYRRLGQLAWQGYQNEQAKKYLQLAIKHTRQNLKAQELLTEIVWSDPNTTLPAKYQRQAEMLLARVAASPFDPRPYHRLAGIAGKCGLTNQFKLWRERWQQVRKRAPTTFGPTTEDQLALAQAAYAVRLYDDSTKILRALLKPKPPASSSAPATQTRPQPPQGLAETAEARIRITLASLAGKQNDQTLLTQQRAWIDKSYRKLLADKEPAMAFAAVLSIYYSTYAGDLPDAPTRALKLAEIANRKPETASDSVKLACALAYAKADDPDRAYRFLKQLSDPREPLAALAKAWVRIAEKKQPLAKDALRAALKNIGPGPSRDKLLETWRSITKDDPPKPEFGNVQTALAEFNEQYLLQPSDPGKFFTVKLRAQNDLTAGQFVRLQLELINAGPVDLSIGPGGLIEPLAAVRIQIHDPKRTLFLLHLPLDARQILKPGQKLTTQGFLDQAVGANNSYLTDYLARTAGKVKKIKLQATISGTVPTGQPRGNQLLQSNAFEITCPGLDRQSADALIAKLENPQEITWQWANRIRPILQGDQFKKQAQVLVKHIAKTIESAETDQAVVLAFVLRQAGPSPEVLNALAKTLRSPNWLCRLVSLDSIGQLQGPKAKKLYEYYATNDRDQRVRQLAAAYLLRRWKQ